MDYKLELNDKLNLKDNVEISLVKKIKEYYKKRPGILFINILIIILSFFVQPILSAVFSFITLFVLPNWKEKKFK